MCSVNDRLLNAFNGQHLEDIETCLSLGGNPNLTSKNGVTLLHSCCNVEVMKILLHHGADVRLKDSEGRTPLHSVLENRRGLPLVQELLNAGIQLGTPDNANCYPLHYAIKFKNGLNVIKELLKHGADVNVKDADGRTPLFYVLEFYENLEILRELLLHGADVKVKTVKGLTVLHSALLYSREKSIVKDLLDNEVVNAEDSCGATPLHYSIRYPNELSIVKLLIHRGAKVNVKDKNGLSPLHDAINLDNVLVVRELLLHGADVKDKDPRGDPPLFMTLVRTHEISSKSWDVIKELFEFGAEIQTKSVCTNNSMLTIFWYISVDWAVKLVKLCVFGYFDVGNKIEELRNYIDELGAPQLLSYLDECVREMVKTKQFKIIGKLSLNHFIVRRGGDFKPLYLPHKNTEIKEYISKTFPIYSDVILPNIDNCLYRGFLLNDLKTVRLCTSVTISDNHCLTYDCLCLIAQYLSNEELCNFIKAFNRDVSV